MIKVLCFVALLVCVLAQRAPVDEAPKPYQFEYAEQIGGKDDVGGSISHSETQDAQGKVQGRYSLEIGDGRKRVVEYVADQDGFKAEVKSNEGLPPHNPADAVFNVFKRK
ncbi:cuticle protein 10.9-like [Centruroides vittatus]|uniref:cuticle protein 10.9-like n=1 Tax=Centruroides vittatus TaxID=120091 RepID=UPI0035105E41